MQQLTIDPEFRDKIPPLSQDEFSKLEENILADGEVREPLVLWHNTIIDGHHRWAIIQKHGLTKYTVKQMDFPDKWAAIVWMCRNQLGRRNVTDEQKTVLIGEAYRAQKMTQGGDRRSEEFSSAQNGHMERKRTADVIAKDFSVGRETVKRAEHFVDSLDKAEKVSPGFRESVLSGAVKAPKSVIAEIRNVPEDKRTQVVEAIKRGDTDTAKAMMKPKQIPAKEEIRPAFDADDLSELLRQAVKSLDSSFEIHLVMTHSDLLDTEAGRYAVKTALNEAKAIIEKYENLVKEKESNG